MAGLNLSAFYPSRTPTSQKTILEGIASSHPEAVNTSAFAPTPAPPPPAPEPQQAPQPAPQPAPAPEPAPAPTPAPSPAAPAPAPAPAPQPMQSPTQLLAGMPERIDAGAGWAQVSTPGQTRPGLGQRLPFVPARSGGVRY